MTQKETIFLQTDPAFNSVLLAISELRDKNRFQVIKCQKACISLIESDDPKRKYRFGGKKAATMSNVSFGRTASAVARMCMLSAVGIKSEFWPNIGKLTRKRNKKNIEKMVFIKPLFRLAINKNKARYYWSKYDQLYPHFLIEDEVRRTKTKSGQTSMPRVMLIFRNDFSRVIEITTSFYAKPGKGLYTFNSSVSVTCIVRDIKKGCSGDGQHTSYLRWLMQPPDIPDIYFEKVNEIIKTEHYDNWKFLFRQKKTKKTSVQNKVEDNEETSEEDNEETSEEDNEETGEEDNEETTEENAN